jgi:hypothetical protein
MAFNDNEWTVYVHTNKINGKKYVGVTQQNPPEKRYGSNGINYIGCIKFYNAIQKYGWNNFEHQIIANCLSKEEACRMEQLLISELDTMNNGYNVEPGGVDQGPRSPEAIRKIREARLKQTITPEQYEKGAAKRRGRKRPAETVKKVRDAMVKTVGVPYICIETGEYFECAADAARKYNTYSSCVLTSARRYEEGKELRKRGYHFKFAKEKPDGQS